MVSYVFYPSVAHKLMSDYNTHSEHLVNGCNLVQSLEHDEVMLHNGITMEDHVPKEDISADDLYVHLAEKERDLELAAELGKALLEQNEELKKNHEQVVEEYNAKLEVRFIVISTLACWLCNGPEYRYALLIKIFAMCLIFVFSDSVFPHQLLRLNRCLVNKIYLLCFS